MGVNDDRHHKVQPEWPPASKEYEMPTLKKPVWYWYNHLYQTDKKALFLCHLLLVLFV